MGSSKPWHDAMEVLTGQRKMDAGALLEYFKPLQQWLEKENQKTGEYIGWISDMSRKYIFSLLACSSEHFMLLSFSFFQCVVRKKQKFK